MGKFNTVTPTKKVVNLAGGKAYKEDSKLELVSLILSTFLQDKFYETGKEQLKRLEGICQAIDPVFLAKASLYARLECGMRSVSHVIAGQIGKIVKGQEWTKRYFEKIVHRPDDMTEILSYYISQFGKPIPNSMKKGLALAMQKFDAYQLAKYRGEGKGIKLVDLMNLIHVKPNAQLQSLYKGELKNTETWEAKLSATKGNEEEKMQAWRGLLSENKLGYMAIIKNIRNIIEQAPDCIDMLCNAIVNEKAIKKSLILPFRFLTALDNITLTQTTGRKILTAIQEGLELSLGNMPSFDGETLIVIDVSGSMQGKPADIGSLFAAVIAKKTGGDIMKFSDSAAYMNYNPSDSVISIGAAIKFSSGGTNFGAIFQTINKHYDRIIILSDMQGWGHMNTGGSMLTAYENKYGKTKLYSWDLNGYGSLMFPQQNVACLAGWSDKAIDLLALIDKGDSVTKSIDDMVI